MDITRVLPPNGEKAQRSKGSHLSSQVGFKPLLARNTPCLFISWWCSILNCLQSRTEHSFSKFGVTHDHRQGVLMEGSFASCGGVVRGDHALVRAQWPGFYSWLPVSSGWWRRVSSPF